ncbi:serine hydrolase [Listeria grayi]|uniref:Beta-lactamase class A catalytic domain-containing protein n=1 Tax=Listeria grayi DSM 20601 TaxID=525367 RepID=D7UUS3_LISGR|nr:serine hydrolase [Listeria grayi]EFI84999.1 hypothetical protein HMPREF0556_10198 [Listeria grayi DSM 20601]
MDLADMKQPPFEYGLLIANEEKILYAEKSEKLFPSASLIKLAVYAYYYELICEGKITAAKIVVVSPEAYPGGAGILALLPQKDRWTIEELLTLMIAVSDNAATNLLIEEVGMSTIQKWLQLKGWDSDVQLNRLMMAKTKPDNYVNASGALALLRFIFSLGRGQNELKHAIQRPFFNQQHRSNLPGGLDEYGISELRIGNKTGELAAVKHDVAVFCYQEKTIWAAALTKHDHQENCVIEWMQHIGKQIFTVLQER